MNGAFGSSFRPPYRLRCQAPPSGRRCRFACRRACGSADARPRRQRPLGARQRLDPPLFVHRQHNGTVGGIHTSPTISCIFLPQSGSRDPLDVLVPVGSSHVAWNVVYRRADHPRSLRQGRQCPVGEMRRRDISTPVRAFTRSSGIGAPPGGRVASCRSPSTPSAGKRFRSDGRWVWTCWSRPSLPTDRSPRRDEDDVRAPSVPAAGLRVFHDACRALAVLFRKRDRCSTVPGHLFFASLPNPPKGDGSDNTALPEEARVYDLDALALQLHLRSAHIIARLT